jgi:hypothetical protein
MVSRRRWEDAGEMVARSHVGRASPEVEEDGKRNRDTADDELW